MTNIEGHLQLPKGMSLGLYNNNNNNNNNNLFSLYDLQFVMILYSVCDASIYRLQPRVGIPTDHLGSICRGSWLTVDLK